MCECAQVSVNLPATDRRQNTNRQNKVGVLVGGTYVLPTYIETTNIESLYVSKKYLFSKLTIPRFSIVAAKKIDSVTIKKLASE